MTPTIMAMAALSSVTLGPPDALAASNVARDAWGYCILSNAAKYSELEESAETIADVSVANCSTLEPAVVKSLDGLFIDNGPKLSDDTIQSIISDGRKTFRNRAVSTVVEIRFKRKEKNGARN